MTRTLVVSAVLLWCGSPAWAQRGPRQAGGSPGAARHGGGQRGAWGPTTPRPVLRPAPVPELRTYGSPHGYGNVVFPGTGHAPGTYSPFSITDPTFGARLSNTVSGFGYGAGYNNGYYYNYGGYRQPYGGTGAVVVPYAVPVYVPYPEPQPQILVAPPPQVIYVVPGEPDRGMTTTAPAPRRESVVTYVAPSRHAPPETRSDPDKKKLYLIAFKNYSIYSASDYWWQGDTIHYLLPNGIHNQASLDQLDLEFTLRLNRERGLEFRLDKDQ